MRRRHIMADKLDKSNPIVKYDRRFCEFKQINLLSKLTKIFSFPYYQSSENGGKLQ